MKKFNRVEVNNLIELKSFLTSIETESFNLVNYVWIEYGFYPILFNELFLPFFNETKGEKIGICFQGHEVFYEPHVDILIVLNNFINTTKAYLNNEETELLINNFKSESDRGIAFWNTVRNFDEDNYLEIIQKFNFRNTIYPIGKRVAWDNNLFILHPGYLYGSGIDGNWYLNNNKWFSTKTLGWEIPTWNKEFEHKTKYELDNYNTFFVKNSWKSRNYSSQNIEDFLVGKNGTSGKKGWGFVDYEFYIKIVNFHIVNKMNIVIINDLSSLPKIDSEYVHYLDMIGFFDTKLFLTTVNNSNFFISTSTSPIDLSAYYCDTNLVLINDKQNKNNFVSQIQKMKNKSSISFDVENDDINNLYKFIKWN
jgi:hypothetical protein